MNQASRTSLAFALALLCSCLAPAHAVAQELVPPALLEAAQPSLPATIKLDAPKVVVVELTIDEQGAARDPSVLTSSGDPALDQIALSASEQLRFRPATRDGVAIAARIPFRFDFAASPEPPPPTPLPPPPKAAEAAPNTKNQSVQAPIVLSVHGDRPPREATSYVISRQEIRTIPGTGGDPLRAIEAMPGVGRAPFGSGDLIIRGSSPNDSAVFINGISVPNNPYHFGGMTSVIPLEALERMDSRPGNFGPEYGRAMGGVVDIGLRAPLKDRYSGVVQFDVIDGRLLVQGPLGKRTRFLVAGRRSWLDAWYGAVIPKDQISVRAAPVYWDGQFVLEHDLTRNTTVQLFAFGSDDKLALLIKAPDAQEPGGGGQLGAHVGFMRVGLRTRTEFSDALTWTNTAAYGPDRQNLHFGSDLFDITVQNLALRSELRARFHERVTGTVGLDVTGLRYDLNLFVKPYPTTDETQGPYFARPSRRFVDQIWMFRPAAYALAEIIPWRGTRLIPSVRVDYTHDTGNVTVDPRFAFRSLLHDGPHSTTLKGGVGLYQQPPLPQESVAPFGTPGVRSNRSLHTSAGVEQGLADGLTVSLELYYKHLSKLVIARADEDGSAIGARFENTGSGRIYGSELMIKYQGNERFTGWLAYTLSRSERRNSNSEPYSLFQYDQTHILSALGTVRLGRNITIGGRFRYITGLPQTPIDGGVLDLDAGAYTPVPGANYSSRVPAFHQLDLRVDKTWKIRKGSLMIYGELRNAYNHKNVEARAYRYDYAQSQKQTGFPIMPVIGLRGEL